MIVINAFVSLVMNLIRCLVEWSHRLSVIDRKLADLKDEDAVQQQWLVGDRLGILYSTGLAAHKKYNNTKSICDVRPNVTNVTAAVAGLCSVSSE